MNLSLTAVQILLFRKQAIKLDFTKWIRFLILVSHMCSANQINRKSLNLPLLVMSAKLNSLKSTHNVSFVLCGAVATVWLVLFPFQSLNKILLNRVSFVLNVKPSYIFMM
jgi:hypothetical protein